MYLFICLFENSTLILLFCKFLAKYLSTDNVNILFIEAPLFLMHSISGKLSNINHPLLISAGLQLMAIFVGRLVDIHLPTAY